MNLLREEFCKETNTPIGLDNVYNYVKWLENKWQQERSYNKQDMIDFAYNYTEERKNKGARAMTPELLIKQFKNK
jgi:hypothetical protein